MKIKSTETNDNGSIFHGIMSQISSPIRERDIQKALNKAVEMATYSLPTAIACNYTIIKTDGTLHGGISVNLAKTIAIAYGNIHFDCMLKEVTSKHVRAVAVAKDLEVNLSGSYECLRSFQKDEYNVVSSAAMSVALRQAILSIIPPPFTNQVHENVINYICGKTQAKFDKRRDEVISMFCDLTSLKTDNILHILRKTNVSEITRADVVKMAGLAEAISAGEVNTQALLNPKISTPSISSTDNVQPLLQVVDKQGNIIQPVSN